MKSWASAIDSLTRVEEVAETMTINLENAPGKMLAIIRGKGSQFKRVQGVADGDSQ